MSKICSGDSVVTISSTQYILLSPKYDMMIE